MEPREKIRRFIQANVDGIGDEANFTDSDNIFELGIVNSLFAMRILKFVQTEFSIEMDENDMEIENFNSIDHIMRFIEIKKQ